MSLMENGHQHVLMNGEDQTAFSKNYSRLVSRDFPSASAPRALLRLTRLQMPAQGWDLQTP
jgi:trans-aconitate methyltransferase